jgi:hypothetical protein
MPAHPARNAARGIAVRERMEERMDMRPHFKKGPRDITVVMRCDAGRVENVSRLIKNLYENFLRARRDFWKACGLPAKASEMRSRGNEMVLERIKQKTRHR